MTLRRSTLPCLASVLAAVALALALPAAAQDMVVYDDDLGAGWQDWGWCTRDFANGAPVHAGTASVAATWGAWEGLYFQRGNLRRTDWIALDFWIHGGASGGQQLDVAFVRAGAPVGSVPLAAYAPGGSVPPGTWTHVTIPVADFSLASDFDGLWLQDTTGGGQPQMFIDDVTLVASGIPPVPVTVSIQPALDRRPVDQRIFGVNSGQPGSDLPYPLRRWGGNATTRYSWEDDVSNRAMDWFWLNVANPDPGTLPDGSSSDVFIDASRAAGADVMLTVPTIGWTPTDRSPRWGFSVARYGAQQATECTVQPAACNPDAGNGIAPGGAFIAFNDPHDTSREILPDFVTRWMEHVATHSGPDAVRLFSLDNEPMLWSSTHRDVHPNRLGYDELWQYTLDYASAMKTQDPGALILGPSSWGWCDYFWSDLDGCGNSAGGDYAAHGPLLEWYLQSVANHEQLTGTRLVDMLEIHYYPQSAGVALSDDESPATQALRFRSVDSLWDPGYTDESWIGTPVRLIPRMKEIIAGYLPGIPLAITEYNWGRDAGISSALAQVEVLGVFAREGVDLATRWEAPAPGTKVEDAFRLYLDYDGAGARVEGTSVRASSSDRSVVEVFGFEAPDGRVFAVLVNETDRSEDVPITIEGASDGPAPVYGFDGATAFGPMGSAVIAGELTTLTLPPLSARLVVATRGCAPPAEATLLMLTKAGASMTSTWTPDAGGIDGVLHEDVAANGAFLGVALSGAAPLDVPLPPGDRYYLVASRNACGEGSLR